MTVSSALKGMVGITHGDILASLSGFDAEVAIEAFIEKIKKGELVIAILR
jgi:hypothetical protein